METNQFIENIASTMRGFEIAERIVSNDQTVHYLVMNRHIEDDMRMLKMVLQLKRYYSGEEEFYKEEKYGKLFKKNYIIKKIVVVTDNVHAGIAKLFSSVDDIIILSEDELIDINFYAKSFICVHPNLHRDEYGSAGDEQIGDDLLKQKLFNVPTYNWILDIPVNFPAKNEWILSDMKLREESLNQAVEVFRTHKVKPEKTVVISPYAKYTSILKRGYWNVCVRQLQKYDYSVFTNVGSDDENPLENTIPLNVSIDTLIAMGHMGILIIGVQSGLMDTIRWFSNDIKSIIFSCLYTDYDFLLARNRKLENKIERRKNITHLLVKKGDSVFYILRDQLSYYRKGNWQKETYKNNRKGDFPLYQKKNLNDYIKELINMPHVIIFLAVCDSANKYWNLFDRSLLGLVSDLSIEWRKSYIAVIDKENDFLYEQMNPNYREIVYQGSFSDTNRDPEFEELGLPEDNRYYVSSHAMGKGHYTKASIVINGEQYALNERGLNIVVFSKTANSVIDSIYVDLWADKNLSVKRDGQNQDILKQLTEP